MYHDHDDRCEQCDKCFSFLHHPSKPNLILHERIEQLDGNMSIYSSNSSEMDAPIAPDSPQPIPVHHGFRPPTARKNEIDYISNERIRNKTLKIIKRDNRGFISLYLPNIAVYNHRSFWSKINNFVKEAKETKQGLTFHSEVWEVKESKKHKKKIEEMMEVEGINYASTARPGRRGGGSAITCDNETFDMKVVATKNPDKHEVTFAIIRPKAREASNIIIIACAMYSVPRSKKKTKLIEFITTNYNNLKIKYPSAFFICGGDINDLKVDHLLTITNNLRQIVTKFTRKQKILSVIITDLHSHYDEPTIFPPVKPDLPGVGKPSDHSTPFAPVHLDTSKIRKRYRLCTVRPLPDSRIRQFGKWIVSEPFKNVTLADNPTDKVEEFNSMMTKKLDDICPSRTVKIFNKDKEWMTPKLQRLRRKKAREYRKRKNSPLFIQLNEEFIRLRNLSSKSKLNLKKRK